MSLISKGIVDRLKNVQIEDSSILGGYGVGGHVNVMGRVKLDFMMDRLEFRGTFDILNEESFSIILGIGWLRRHGTRFNLSDNLSQQQNYVRVKDKGGMVGTVFLWTLEDALRQFPGLPQEYRTDDSLITGYQDTNTT